MTSVSLYFDLDQFHVNEKVHKVLEKDYKSMNIFSKKYFGDKARIQKLPLFLSQPLEKIICEKDESHKEKNQLDFEIFYAISKDLLQNPDIGLFLVASRDSDFCTIAKKVKEAGKFFGMVIFEDIAKKNNEKLSNKLKSVCDVICVIRNGNITKNYINKENKKLLFQFFNKKEAESEESKQEEIEDNESLESVLEDEEYDETIDELENEIHELEQKLEQKNVTEKRIIETFQLQVSELRRQNEINQMQSPPTRKYTYIQQYTRNLILVWINTHCKTYKKMAVELDELLEQAKTQCPYPFLQYEIIPRDPNYLLFGPCDFGCSCSKKGSLFNLSKNERCPVFHLYKNGNVEQEIVGDNLAELRQAIEKVYEFQIS